MDIAELSTICRVQRLEPEDAGEVLQLCRENEIYYHYCPPFPSENSILFDMRVLPQGKEYKDKYYIGFYDDDRLAAVMDLILHYPEDQVAYIGFFMVDIRMQGRGFGSNLIKGVCSCLEKGFDRVRLGYVKENEQSRHFWQKNLFRQIGEEKQAENYTIVVMERMLRL